MAEYAIGADLQQGSWAEAESWRGREAEEYGSEMVFTTVESVGGMLSRSVSMPTPRHTEGMAPANSNVIQR
jgi:hypothetical protein